jgi:hypothetical protein
MPALRLARLESMKEIREVRGDAIKIARSILAADLRVWVNTWLKPSGLVRIGFTSM